MATLTFEGIQNMLGELGVEIPILSFPQADIQNSPMGIYLSHVADILVQITDCAPQVAYDSIQWPNDSADFEVVVPRLRIQDAEPSDLAIELKHRV